MLGRALGREFPEAERFTGATLDIADAAALRAALAPHAPRPEHRA